MNLQNIFRVLKGCTIDPGIMAINTQQNDQRKQHATLFDYIDHQSVLDIQKQADDEIGDIEASELYCHVDKYMPRGWIADKGSHNRTSTLP